MNLRDFLRTCGNDYKLLKIWFFSESREDFKIADPDWTYTKKQVQEALPPAFDWAPREIVVSWYLNYITGDLCVLVKQNEETV